MKKRILRIAEKAFQLNPDKALQNLAWYDYAGRFCADIDRDNDLASGTTAGVVAALSPLNTWEAQVKFTAGIVSNALTLIRQGAPPHSAITLSFFSNKDKAARILLGEKPLDVLGGDKVRSFYRNLTGDFESVTIDRHALAIAGWKGPNHDNRANNPHYRTIADAFRAASKSFGLAPAEIQALTWCAWRDGIK